MKQFLKLIFIIGILFLSYQGWLKFFADDQLPASNSATTQSDVASSTFKDSLNQAVGTLQSSVLSLISKTDKADLPASSIEVSHSEEQIISQLADYIVERTSHFVIDVYGERELVSSSMEKWIDEALSTDDYTRYATQAYKYSIIGYSKYSEVSFSFEFRESEEQTDYVRSFVKDLLKTNNVAELNKHEKVKWIHDWIVSHVQYDETLTKYTAYEALTEKLAVCQGYALLGQMMLEEAGLEAKIAEGEVSTGSHAWNMVKLDDIWYHIDFTWDDPVGQAEDEISYQYYLVSDETLRKDHSWVKHYPAATLDYKDVLKHAITAAVSEEQRSALEYFQQSIDLHWYEPEYTINNQEELNQQIKSLTAKKQHELSFRYINGSTLVADLNQAFQKTNVGLAYNVQYKELSDQGDALVTLTITYN